ncbi:uncharacterized protein LOC134221219 [Armigeres subalbatus]|uniref:uncharacterized protein LOC134221219 n=1 Tax=Armigeres subalbatus TaxID=124917 RepID=UPI002ED0994A
MQKMKEQQALGKRHLEEKFKLMEEVIEDQEDAISNRSRVSGRTSMDRVKQWQQQCLEQGASAICPKQMDKSTGSVAALPILKPGDPNTTIGNSFNSTNPVVVRDQQRYTGTIPKTSRKQHVEDSRGKIKPSLPPVAPQGAADHRPSASEGL